MNTDQFLKSQHIISPPYFLLYQILERAQLWKFCKLSFHVEIKPKDLLSNQAISTERLSTAKSYIYIYIYICIYKDIYHIMLIVYSSGDFAVSFPDHYFHKKVHNDYCIVYICVQ